MRISPGGMEPITSYQHGVDLGLEIPPPVRKAAVALW